MNAMHSVPPRSPLRALSWLAALLMLCLAAASAFAQDDTDPPGRAAFLSYRQGSIVFAPQGDDEWIDLPANRPLTAGDRLWSDRGARAELQLGSATLQVDGESHLGVSDLDERSAQFILQQGAVNARVRELLSGENFEIGTPNIAFRALQPGDYRIDVDPDSQQTRVVVRSGLASVFGDGGQSIHLGAGQQAVFAGRSLAQVQAPAWRQDDFDVWVAERNRLEDQAIAARYVPRGVVGASQLDAYGTWSQDPSYGAVWYPTVTVVNWAPYRYGHWEWIGPWGWTWVDDAPWGFAPFHYGRWTMIGTRWAWVPGRMVARPVYAPALVVFLGGGSNFNLAIGSDPAVGWYPLAPGEAWWPAFRSSPRYVSHANFNINLNAYPRNYANHFWRQRPFAVTAVGVDDFRRGRPVERHWQPIAPRSIGGAQPGVVPPRPELRRPGEMPGNRLAPRLVSTPPAAVPQQAWPQQRFFGGGQAAPAVREQFRAQREQDRLQRDAERTAREQMRQQDQVRHQQDLRIQRDQLIVRQQQEQARQRQELQAQREQQMQRLQQEQAARNQQERAAREAFQREQGRVRVEPPRTMQQQVQPVVVHPQPQAAGVQERQARQERQERAQQQEGGHRQIRGDDPQQQQGPQPQWQSGWQGRGHWR